MRLPLLLLSPLLTLALTLASQTDSTVSPDTQRKLEIDFLHSHYDVDKCGRALPGRARRHGGDDYNDALEFSVLSTEDSPTGTVPWAVALVTKVPSSSSPRICVGTLISRRHILTAAHCLSKKERIEVNYGKRRCSKKDHMDLIDFMQRTEVRYGGECLDTDDSSCTEEEKMSKRGKIVKTILYPFFEEECTQGSNLVIFELEEDVTVPHACLPHLHDVTLERKATYSSFGWAPKRDNNHTHTSRMQTMKLGYIKDHCDTAWEAFSPDVLCYSHQKEYRQCAGDSGSGLLTTVDDRVFLVGVLSTSTLCHQKRSEADESRFTDLRLFSSTIDRVIGTVGVFPDDSDRN